MSKKFEWTDELKEKYISFLERELSRNGLLPERFRSKFIETIQKLPDVSEAKQIAIGFHEWYMNNVGSLPPMENEQLFDKYLQTIKTIYDAR